MLTIRHLPDDVHRALRMQAAYHGRSTGAEVREILAFAVKPEKRVRPSAALAALNCEIGLANDDLKVFDQVQDEMPAEPARFE